MVHYTDHFKGKVVYCNCDDPYESNLFKYFAINFNRLGLKQLMTTCYASSPMAWRQLTLGDVFSGKKEALSKPDNKKPNIIFARRPDGW